MPTVHAGIEQGGRLIRRPRLPLLIIRPITPALRTQNRMTDRQLLYLLILLDNLQLLLLGVFNYDLLLLGEREEVPAELTYQPVPCCRALDEEQLEAKRTKFHFYYKRKYNIRDQFMPKTRW